MTKKWLLCYVFVLKMHRTISYHFRDKFEGYFLAKKSFITTNLDGMLPFMVQCYQKLLQTV